MKIEPGIYHGVTFEEYKAWEAVNNSVLSRLATKSPAHARAYVDDPPDDTETFIFGRAFHSLLLEPDTFDSLHIIVPPCDRRTKEGKQIYADFLAISGTRTMLRAEDYATMQAMVEAVKQHIAYSYISDAKAEVSICWQDSETGLLCKARLDSVCAEQADIIDVKTTQDASLAGFSKSIQQYNYGQQGAFYVDGWASVSGQSAGYAFVACEKAAPFGVAMFQISETVLSSGRKSYRAALATWKDCVENGVWPSYENSVQVITE